RMAAGTTIGPIMFLALFLAFFLQGISAQPVDGGSITGVLRSPNGGPAAGIRIAAIVPPEPGASDAAVMAVIAETDASGGFELDNVPPGRYYIAAGRVDLQTYYPGVLEMAEG